MSAWYEVEEHFQKKAINVEKAIYLQRKETYFDTTHIIYVSILGPYLASQGKLD